MMFYVGLNGEENSKENQDLQDKCLHCHIQQQIPDELIYRRYLMTYSTTERITKAMMKYLKNPKKEDSIMPPQFFLKFPMKEVDSLNNESLERDIRVFLDMFDVKKKLVLPK